MATLEPVIHVNLDMDLNLLGEWIEKASQVEVSRLLYGRDDVLVNITRPPAVKDPRSEVIARVMRIENYY